MLDEYFSEAGFVPRLHDQVWDKAALQRLLAAQRRYLQSPRDRERFPREIGEAFWLPEREARRCGRRAGFGLQHAVSVYEQGCEQLHDMAYRLFAGESVHLTDSNAEQVAAVQAPACSPAEARTRQALLDESLADDGFVLRLRCDLQWDRPAFGRLRRAMRAYLAARANAPWLDRETAELFWRLEWFVPAWSSHANFPREHAAGHYDEVFAVLGDLAIPLFVEGDLDANGDAEAAAMWAAP
ncbi:hypothetical protein [Lysobacter sp. yr284]|uniref:hypothetical protein n=1 Tax=Lysobacter sp. yr284 TaxID=1761791 RepID=UPI000B83997B|nr:hypothetical protein [Lysobacter sp. yr284]